MAIHFINSHRYTPVGLMLAAATGVAAIAGSATATTAHQTEAQASGDVSIGGSAVGGVSIAQSVVASGGIQVSGVSTPSASISQSASASGGVSIGAGSSAVKTRPASASGDIIIDGGAVALATQSVSASGGINIGGSTAGIASQLVSASGGVVIGGTGIALADQPASASGGIVVGASSATPSQTCWPLNFPVTFPMPCGSQGTPAVAAGGIVIGASSTATVGQTASVSATGNIIIGGSSTGVAAQGSSSINGIATGNIVIGGSSIGVAAQSLTASGIATGNIIIGGSSIGVAAQASSASTQTDVINLSPSLFHRSEDITDSDSDGYANTWPEYGGGTQYQQDGWGSSHPDYISSDPDFNGHPVVDFSGNHVMTLRTNNGTGNSAQHYFIVLAYVNTSNWNQSGYIHGNPWGPSNRLYVSTNSSHYLNNTWRSFVGLNTTSASNWNHSSNTIRKNGQVLSSNEQRYTPIANVRDTSGATWITSATNQSTTVNSTSDWVKPVLYEWESNGTKTFNPRWFGRYSSGLVVPMKVAEIVGFSSALSSTDAATVRSYLGNKFSISMT